MACWVWRRVSCEVSVGLLWHNPRNSILTWILLLSSKVSFSYHIVLTQPDRSLHRIVVVVLCPLVAILTVPIEAFRFVRQPPPRKPIDFDSAPFCRQSILAPVYDVLQFAHDVVPILRSTSIWKGSMYYYCRHILWLFPQSIKESGAKNPRFRHKRGNRKCVLVYVPLVLCVR